VFGSYLNAIQTMCPHILRYLATAVIINRPRRSALKDLVKVIQQVCNYDLLRLLPLPL
jgi:translation initiation factor 3 subunit E